MAPARDALTVRQVTERHGRLLHFLLSEWREATESLVPMLRVEQPLPKLVPSIFSGVVINDVVVHEGDIRITLGLRSSAGRSSDVDGAPGLRLQPRLQTPSARASAALLSYDGKGSRRMNSVRSSHESDARVLFAVTALVIVAGACSSGWSTSSTKNPTGAATAPSSVTSTAKTSTAPPEPQRFEVPLPAAVQEAAAATTGHHLYVIGGYDTARNSSAAVFVFNGSAWTRGPSLPIPVNHPGAAAIGTDVYLAGGFSANEATNRVFRLVGGSSHWSEVAPMRRARGALALLSSQGHLVAIGGRNGTTQVAVPERYDPASDTWTDLAPMPNQRNHLAGYIDQTSECVAGGRTPATSSAIDCFDTRTATLRAPQALPIPTSGAAAGVVNGVTVVAGGEPAGETRIVPVIQELRSGVWTTQPMLEPRHGTAYAIYRGRLWACGGATAPGFQAVAACTSISP